MIFWRECPGLESLLVAWRDLHELVPILLFTVEEIDYGEGSGPVVISGRAGTMIQGLYSPSLQC